MSWRENNRLVDDGAERVAVIGVALTHTVNRTSAGYRQRTQTL
jgi:hypothetical protein